MAVFPNGVKNFPTHKNMDTVEAYDINAIQDEVVAIQRTLGSGLNRDEAKQVFSSLSARMEYLEKSQGSLAFELVGSDRNPRSGVSNNWALPTRFDFPAPSNVADPLAVYNGYGVTLPVSGFWLLEGFVDWQATSGGHSGPHGGTSGNPSTFVAAVTINGSDWARGADIMEEFTSNSGGAHHFLNPSRLGWVAKGTKVTLHTHHTSSHPHAISMAALSGFCLRQG